MPAYKWEFYKNANGKWEWRKKRTKNGAVVIASTADFDNQQAAVADARTQGYRGCFKKP